MSSMQSLSLQADALICIALRKHTTKNAHLKNEIFGELYFLENLM